MKTTDAVNRIHNATFQFNFNTPGSAKLNGNDFVDWIKTNVLETIDQYANELTDVNKVVQIPELSIDLEIEGAGDIFKDSHNRRGTIIRQIRSALKKSIRLNRSATISIKQYNANLILGYLQSGQLESDFSDKDWDDLTGTFFDELLTNESLQSKWAETIRNKNAFIRFFNLKSIREIKTFLRKWTGEKNAGNLLTGTVKLLELNRDAFSSINTTDFYYKVLNLLPLTKMSVKLTLQKIIRQEMVSGKTIIKDLEIPANIAKELITILEGDTLDKEPEDLIEEATESHVEITDTAETGAHVGQAGLVLLAPFLPQFLKNIKYTDAGGQVLNRRDLPILFHYIATGDPKAPEWKLTLPKIMAGLRPGEHCNTELKPTKKPDRQIEELLNAVIAHWAALKKTSPDGLRDTFLIRQGELKFKNGFYYLYIQEQTVDILLSYISWNFSTIKLDWMRDIIFVEWNKQI